MSGGQDDDVGTSYLETQQAMGRIFGENLPILVLLTPFSSSASIRQLPSASAICRRLPFRVASGPCVLRQHGWGQDDVGREYLETQHAMGQIFGENRPILELLMPFSASVSIRLLPSASTICRRLPFRVASGPRA